MGRTQLTNASSGTVNARRFQSQWAAVVTAVVFEFSVMRCQPLRRALAARVSHC
ncbi:acetyltransferase [Vibrio cholerae]|nr:acetyltransferase [Vibrio cholerae]MEB3764414.1 acetyltransferase [Vibrio cholerae]